MWLIAAYPNYLGATSAPPPGPPSSGSRWCSRGQPCRSPVPSLFPNSCKINAQLLTSSYFFFPATLNFPSLPSWPRVTGWGKSPSGVSRAKGWVPVRGQLSLFLKKLSFRRLIRFAVCLTHICCLRASPQRGSEADGAGLGCSLSQTAHEGNFPSKIFPKVAASRRAPSPFSVLNTALKYFGAVVTPGGHLHHFQSCFKGL